MKKGPLQLPRTYIAGPMTGCSEHNFPAFRKAAASLRQLGHVVISPEELETAEGPGPRKSWEYYLKRDIRELLTCDSIAVLPNWQNSRGATLEVYIGWRLGFPIFEFDTLNTVDVSRIDFSEIQNESEAGSFLRAFTPPRMTRSIADVAFGLETNPGTVDKEYNIPGQKFHVEKPKPKNILKEADEIVGGDRNSDYGHPKTDFERTAMIWSAILGIKVSAEQIPLCMIGVKMSRQCNKAKRDNWVDIAGYSQTGYMVDQKDGRME